MQSVYFEVPVDKYDELAKFDGSLIMFRTAGELGAMCHTEAANFLALNLAYDIINGNRDVDDARSFYAQTMREHTQGQSSQYTQELMFEPASKDAGDPDRQLSGSTTGGSRERDSNRP